MILAGAAGRLGRDPEVANGSRKEDRERERSVAVPASGETRGLERGGMGAGARYRRALASHRDVFNLPLEAMTPAAFKKTLG